MDKKLQNNEDDALRREDQLITPLPDTDDTVAEVEDPKEAAPKKPAPRKQGVATLIIGILLLLGLATAAWYWFVGPGSPSTPTDTATVTEVAPYEEHVAAVFTELKGQVASVATVTSLGGQTSSGALVYDFAPYQVPGTTFRVLPDT